MDCRITGSCENYALPTQPEDQYLGGTAAPAPAAALKNPDSIQTASAAADESRFWTRFWGGAKALGGALETSAGIGLGAFTTWTGFGAAAGIGIAAHGGDTTVSGVRQIWSGAETRTATSQGIAALTGNETLGELVDAGLGIAGAAGAGVFSKAAVGEPLVAKTTAWTSRLSAGSGETGWFGSMLLSKLGSGLDRAQARVHEKIHSLLSPDAFAPFAQVRADLRAFLYTKSSFMRYTEEALAETGAQLATRGTSGLSLAEAVKEGVVFPLENGYVQGGALAAETAGVAAKAADTEQRVWAAAGE